MGSLKVEDLQFFPLRYFQAKIRHDTKTMNLINKNQPPAARGRAIQVQKRLMRSLMKDRCATSWNAEVHVIIRERRAHFALRNVLLRRFLYHLNPLQRCNQGRFNVIKLP